MGFWLDLISGRRYPSAYEPLRYIPDEELAEFGPDGEGAVRDQRDSGVQERPDVGIQAGSAA